MNISWFNLNLVIQLAKLNRMTILNWIILPKRMKIAYLQMQLVCSLDSQHVFAITNLFLIFSKFGLSPLAANRLNLEALVEEVWNRWSRPLSQVWPPTWQWWTRSRRACWRTSAPRGQRRQPRPEARWSARPCAEDNSCHVNLVYNCYRLSFCVCNQPQSLHQFPLLLCYLYFGWQNIHHFELIIDSYF